MTKFTAILAAAILAISFAPAATAVCNDGEIALGHTVHDEYWIYANGCNYISNRGHYGGVCGNYGSSIVYCNSQGVTIVHLKDGSNWGDCYGVNESCGSDNIGWCCQRQ